MNKDERHSLAQVVAKLKTGGYHTKDQVADDLLALFPAIADLVDNYRQGERFGQFFDALLEHACVSAHGPDWFIKRDQSGIRQTREPFSNPINRQLLEEVYQQYIADAGEPDVEANGAMGDILLSVEWRAAKAAIAEEYDRDISWMP